MTKLILNIDLKTKPKGKSNKKKRVNKRKKQTKGKPENIALKAHNPEQGIPFNIAHNTPLVIEKPNIEQANKVSSLTEKVDNQNKQLQEDKAKVGTLITTLNNNKNESNMLLDSLKKDENKVTKLQKQLTDQNKTIEDGKIWV